MTRKTQTTLPFDHQYRERLALIRSLCARHWPRDLRLRVLLETCHRIAQDRDLHRSIGQLAAELACSRDTARRTIRRAEQLGLIRASAQHYASGAQKANAYRIEWTRLRDLAGLPAQAPAQSATPPSQNAGRPSQNAGRAPCNAANPSELGINKPPTPTSPAAAGDAKTTTTTEQHQEPAPPATPGRADRRRELERRLVAAGLADARGALAAALAAGHTLDTAAAVLEHFEARPGAWPPGALHWRLAKAHPELPAAAGWPPATSAHERREAEARRRERLAAEHAERIRRRAALDQREADRREADRRAHEALEALDAEALQRLAQTLPGFLRDRWQRDPESATVRAALAAQLARSEP